MKQFVIKLSYVLCINFVAIYFYVISKVMRFFGICLCRKITYLSAVKLKDKNFATFSKLNKENIKTKEMTELIFNELLELQKTAIKNAKNYLKIMQIYTIQKVTILQLEYLN